MTLQVSGIFEAFGGILLNPGQLQNDILGNTGQLPNIQVDPKISRMPYKCCPMAKFGLFGQEVVNCFFSTHVSNIELKILC